MNAPPADFTRELETALRIALEAAELVRGYHGKQIDVDRKGGDEPVTEADRRASELIVGRLLEAFPADRVLSEEIPDDGSRLGHARVWMVDPIDGTRDFIRGDDGYAVMIGLCVEGRPRVGVVAQPPTRTTYLGALGLGAWKETPAGRVPLRPSRVEGGDPVRLVASKSHRGPEIDAVRRALGIQDEMNIGGVGLKVSLVAEGVRDLYVYPGDKTKLWDSCAPEAILRAAGGEVTDLQGRPLAYDAPELANRSGLVCSNGLLHAHVIAALATAGVRVP